ncbi:MAG: hypothetical protein VYA30_05125 [Myxococcota bacterium]|nr:hypothetical protein [Myxococcota bacterium]
MKVHACIVFFALLTVYGCDDPAPPARDNPDARVEPDVQMFEPDAMVAPDLAIDMAVIPTDAAPLPRVPAAVETSIAVNETVAGATQRVTCTVVDADGAIIEDTRTRIDIRPSIGWSIVEGEEQTYVGQSAQTYQVRCIASQLGLQDDTPAQWQVSAGPSTRLRAKVEPATITAGESASTLCEGEDSYGNPTDVSQVGFISQPNNVMLANGQATGTVAGRYLISCIDDGTASIEAAPLVIEPSTAVDLVVGLDPQLQVYPLNSILSVNAYLIDAFGNRVTEPGVEWSIEPPLPEFGPGRFQLNQEGNFELTVSANTDEQVLERAFPIRVDSSGPSIQCTAPSEAAMLRVGDNVVLQGQVNDTSGIGLVEVDDIPVPIDAAGAFSWPVEPVPGVNVHTVTALDEFGQETQVICTYFAAVDYLPEEAPLPDAITLDFAPAAIDDGPGKDPIRSFADLFRYVIDSPALVDIMNQAAVAQNPIINDQCLQRFLGICVARATVNYQSLAIRGARTVSMGLYNGGLLLAVRLDNVRINVRVNGTVSSSGYLEANSIVVGGQFALGLSEAGVPQLTLDPASAVLDVGNLSSDFSGFGGFLIDLIFPIISGDLTGQLSGTLGDFIFVELDTILSGALAGLDLSAFSLGFDIESPSGDSVEIAMPTSLTTMNASETRMRIGLGTRVTGPSLNPRPSAGIPLFGPIAVPERNDPGSLSALINLGLVNQLMHGLWRANFFNLDDAGGLLGDDAGGIGFGFNLLVPPAVEPIPGEDRLRVHFGPARGSLTYPDLFEEPISLVMAATLTLDVLLSDDGELQFGANGLQFETLRLLIEGVQMEAADQEALEEDLGQVVQALAGGALNQALPSLPVPSISLPEELVEYGVPANTVLGLSGPRLNLSPTHILLDGDLGQ